MFHLHSLFTQNEKIHYAKLVESFSIIRVIYSEGSRGYQVKKLFACQNVRFSVTVWTVFLKWTIQQTPKNLNNVRLAETVRTHFSIENKAYRPNKSEHFLKNLDRKFSTGVILVDSYQQLKRIVICVKWNIDLVYFL